MGNKVHTPAYSYDEAAATYSTEEIYKMKRQFKSLCRANQSSIRRDDFIQISDSPILRNNFLPRLFEVMDVKNEKEIRFDSYLCTLAMLRKNNMEDISAFLVMIYGSPNSKSMRRENMCNLLLDSNSQFSDKECDNFSELEKRSKHLESLLLAMVDIVFHRYAVSYTDKLSFPEFCEFVRDDSSVQSFIQSFPVILGARSDKR